MTRLYAGWAPGEVLNFGWALGVTASHSDILDYRAMLARVKWRARWPGYPNLPAALENWVATREPPSKAYDCILALTVSS